MKKNQHLSYRSSTDIANEILSNSLIISQDACNELLSSCSYGIEYIIDEVFKNAIVKDNLKTSIDWFGVSDLTIE